MEPSGRIEPGFEAVADAFAANFAQHDDVGAAVAVFHRGRPVVDLWGGHTDAERTRSWRSDTVATVFSTTKGITAVCANLLIERGVLDPDAPVADVWPDFAANGKDTITLRMVLSHQAGLAAVDGVVTMADVLGWDGVCAAIAAQAPNWPPGTAHGYHARSYGWIVGEVVRRVTGRSLGHFLADEIAGPHGLDIWVGAPSEVLPRCADLVPAPAGVSLAEVFGADSLAARVMEGPSGLFASGYDESWNATERRTVEMPSSNGIADARSLARLYAMTIGEVDGVRLLAPATVATATEVQASGPECVLGVDMTFGLGFSLAPTLAEGVGPTAFGHAGAGGSVAFADPEYDLAFAYVMNRLRFDLTGDPRSAALVAATYAAL